MTKYLHCTKPSCPSHIWNLSCLGTCTYAWPSSPLAFNRMTRTCMVGIISNNGFLKTRSSRESVASHLKNVPWSALSGRTTRARAPTWTGIGTCGWSCGGRCGSLNTSLILRSKLSQVGGLGSNSAGKTRFDTLGVGVVSWLVIMESLIKMLLSQWDNVNQSVKLNYVAA